jgi:hypothetical protein
MSSVVRTVYEPTIKVIVSDGDIQVYVPAKRIASVLSEHEFFANTAPLTLSGAFHCLGRTVTLCGEDGQHTSVYSFALPEGRTEPVYIQTWSHDPTMDLKIIRL